MAPETKRERNLRLVAEAHALYDAALETLRRLAPAETEALLARSGPTPRIWRLGLAALAQEVGASEPMGQVRRAGQICWQVVEDHRHWLLSHARRASARHPDALDVRDLWAVYAERCYHGLHAFQARSGVSVTHYLCFWIRARTTEAAVTKMRVRNPNGSWYWVYADSLDAPLPGGDELRRVDLLCEVPLDASGNPIMHGFVPVEALLEEAERVHFARWILDRCSPAERAILKARHFDDASFDEMIPLLDRGTTKQAVHIRYQRICGRLRNVHRARYANL